MRKLFHQHLYKGFRGQVPNLLLFFFNKFFKQVFSQKNKTEISFK